MPEHVSLLWGLSNMLQCARYIRQAIQSRISWQKQNINGRHVGVRLICLRITDWTNCKKFESTEC